MAEAGVDVEIVRVQGRGTADAILAALRANGIPARIEGEALAVVYGFTLDGLGEVAIVVPAEYEAAVRELLAAAELHQLEVGEDEKQDG